MIAKAIHYNSPRRDKSFIRVNCGALTGTLLESELFGHVKGSFTGAIRDKQGRFEAADGGTIFLDEIGTLEPRIAGEAAARSAGARIRARRRHADGEGGRARHRRHQRRSAGGSRQGQFPRGSVLSAERRAGLSAAAAQSPRGHPAADRFLPGQIQRPERPQAPANQPGHAQRPAALSLAGQRARTGKRHRAGRRAEQRRGFSRGAACR